jgi:hypothetical protein
MHNCGCLEKRGTCSDPSQLSSDSSSGSKWPPGIQTNLFLDYSKYTASTNLGSCPEVTLAPGSCDELSDTLALEFIPKYSGVLHHKRIWSSMR